MGRITAALERHEFAKHVLTLMSGTAVAQILPLLVMPVIGHYVSPAELGVFAAVTGVIMFLVPLATARYDLAIVLPRSDEEALQLVRLSTLINTLVCALATVVLVVFGDIIARSWLHQPGARGWIFAAGGIAWVYAEVVLLSYWLTRKKNYRLIASNKIHQSVSTSGIQVGASMAGLSVGGLVAASLIGQVAALANLLRKAGPELRRRPQTERTLRDLAVEYRKMPLLNGPNAIADSVRLNGMPIMLNALFSQAIAGHFAWAWRALQMPLSLINGAISQVFFQQLTTVERGQMTATVRKSIVRSALLGVVPFGLLALLCPVLLPWFLSPRNPAKWALAGQIGAVLVPWLFMNLMTSPVSTLFIVVRRQGTMLLFSLAYMAVPLWIIWSTRPTTLSEVDGAAILRTTTYLSWSMAGLLVIFLGLALWVARAWDRGIGERAIDEEAATLEVEPEATEA